MKWYHILMLLVAIILTAPVIVGIFYATITLMYIIAAFIILVAVLILFGYLTYDYFHTRKGS